jgi:3-oxoadipate enol-lactonase
MKCVTSEDAQLRCEHAPRPGAPALLLINALGTSLEMWDDQLTELQERFEVIRFDVRGHGKSSTGTRTTLTMEQLARDALAVLDACGIARAHLCGLSLGGMIAMQMAQLSPDRVLKIILSNTSAYMPPREAWQARIEAVTRQGMLAVTDTVIRRWFTPEFMAAEPERVERIRQMLLATQPPGYSACCSAIRDMDLRDAIRSINATTLVIGGSKDPSTPPAEAEFISQSIPDARLVMLEAAHLSNVERAAEFTATVLEFLGVTEDKTAD